ncbi:ABC transporter ATP-binding protein [Sedimentibacter sp.]|uniref:ABC transporter ATP-binding protein n=1 Tax=Sedimentibacter sp. TaxID=1960295 RepID=UPI0028A64647|nr:ABC transporter ATP-binding protein [Sedimentibacter sp.]
MTLLSIKNENVIYKVKNKSIHAVNNVSFDIEQQDSLGIVGESGSGKSTLALSILRLLPKKTTEVSGEIIFEGINLLDLSESELENIRWKEISVVFQKSMNSLSPIHKIGSQMSDIYMLHNKTASKAEVKNKMTELLELVNLPQRVYTMYQHELSGGMMQRVSIALSLMHNPKLIIMDEATTALDVITQGQILSEITELEKRLNVTRIMITHDMSVVANTCKKIAVMYAGNLVEFGFVKDIISNPKHPYTQGLLKSFPTLKGERGVLRGISGSLPDLSVQHDGCIFESRCAAKGERCLKEKPGTVILENGRMVMCHSAGGDN